MYNQPYNGSEQKVPVEITFLLSIDFSFMRIDISAKKDINSWGVCAIPVALLREFGNYVIQLRDK